MGRKYDDRDLFERYYWVRFRYSEARTVEDLRRHGTMVSEHDWVNRHVESHFVDSELTIDAMFEMWRRGVSVRVKNYDDTAEIYDIIQYHLEQCSEAMRTGVNRRSPELMKDLVDLDEFASVVYKKASSVFSEQTRRRVRQGDMDLGDMITSFNIFKSDERKIKEVKRDSTGKEHTVYEKTNEEKLTAIKERQSMGDIFTEHLSRTGGYHGR